MPCATDLSCDDIVGLPRCFQRDQLLCKHMLEPEDASFEVPKPQIVARSLAAVQRFRACVAVPPSLVFRDRGATMAEDTRNDDAMGRGGGPGWRGYDEEE
eukprot:12468778-Alexandrium_andersonii.AAC.1